MHRPLFVLVFLLFTNYSFSQSEGTCTGGSFEIVKPFLGSWKEYAVNDNEEKFIGTLQTEIGLDGCTISQRFTSEGLDFSYLSFGYVEPSSNIWEETYVFNTGDISKYHWLVEGQDILMRRIGGTRKLKYMHQLRLTKINEDSYEVIDEHSYDAGKTWENKELTRIKRVN